jgi:membrane protein YqaA with SNARE-associated domain
VACRLLSISTDVRWLTRWLFTVFASPIGVLGLAALDSTLFFSLPFGIDTAVIVSSAHLGAKAWILPLLATAGATAGGALTFWMGVKVGEKGLDRYASQARLEKIRRRVRNSGAIALAALDLIPPPFPFTLFVLAAGALEVKGSTFFMTLVACRLLRFGVEAALAVVYGGRILKWLNSDLFHDVVGGMIVLAVALTIVSLVKLVRSGDRTGRRAAA